MAPSSEARDRMVAALAAWRVVPVLRTHDAARLHEAALGLLRGGWGVIELTATSPGWRQVLGSLRSMGALVGIGTVANAAEVHDAVQAGADFLVTPGYRPDLVAAAGDVPFVAGAATPTEIDRVARTIGGPVKVFPAAQLGGAPFVAAVRATAPAVDLMPTGGIRLPDVRAHLDAGAIAVGVGGTDWFTHDLTVLLHHMAQLRTFPEEEHDDD